MSEKELFATAEGSVYLEIHLKLKSESGREKHTNLEEQGAWIAWKVWKDLKDANGEAEDIQISKIDYWGTRTPHTGEPVKTISD